MNFYKYESYKLLSKALVSIFKQFIENNEKSFILSGGSSPKQFLRYLAQERLDWSEISLILSDERLVIPTDTKSNYRFIKTNLLDRISKKRKPKLFPLLNSNSINKKYLLEKINLSYKKFPRPETAFIGVGSDGHFASIFTNSIKQKNSFGYFLAKKEDENFKRISLTIDNFLSCRNIFLLIHGEGKESILSKILDLEEKNHIPILYFLSKFKGDVNVYTDVKINS